MKGYWALCGFAANKMLGARGLDRPSTEADAFKPNTCRSRSSLRVYEILELLLQGDYTTALLRTVATNTVSVQMA